MTRIPTALPQLRRGRHRRKRHGVCLMEYTSILAGEPFSDHPRCTDPVLATVARTVNDYISDEARQPLVVLASDLTTLSAAGPEVGYDLARRCLLTALPYASVERRYVITVGLLGLDRAAQGQSRGWDAALLDLDSELALGPCSHDLDEAAAMLRRHRVSPGEYVRRGLPVAIEAAVSSIAQNAPQADRILAGLLTDCMSDVSRATATAKVPSAICAASSDTSATNQPST